MQKIHLQKMRRTHVSRTFEIRIIYTSGSPDAPAGTPLAEHSHTEQTSGGKPATDRESVKRLRLNRTIMLFNIDSVAEISKFYTVRLYSKLYPAERLNRNSLIQAKDR